MNDLLKTLGEAARDDRTLSPASDEEAAATSPLDERTREAMVEAALSALTALPEAPASRPESSPPAPYPLAAEGTSPASRPLAAEGTSPASRPLAIAAKRPAPAAAPRPVVARLARWPYGAAAALAVAASIAFLLVFRPLGGGGDGDGDLPAYSLALSGSVSELRGEPAAPNASANVRPSSTLTLVVRPEAPVARALEARAFVEQNGTLRRLETPIEISPEGALRLVARADRLFDPPRGTHRLFVAVGPRGSLPEGASLEALRGARGVRLTEAQITVEAPLDAPRQRRAWAAARPPSGARARAPRPA